jgi:hypothetical protein
MEPEALSPLLQHLTACPCPEPDQSSLKPPTSFFKIHSNLGLPSARFLKFPQQNPVYTSPLLYSTSVICSSGLIVLCLITQKAFGEQYRLWCLLLLSTLYSPVTSTISGPNTFLSTLFSNTLRQSYTLCVLTTNCKLPDRKVPGIPWVQSCVNFFMDAVLICWDCSQIPELCPHC